MNLYLKEPTIKDKEEALKCVRNLKIVMMNISLKELAI